MEFAIDPLKYAGDNMDFGIRMLPVIKDKDDFWETEDFFSKSEE
jgi:hypothetical protein